MSIESWLTKGLIHLSWILGSHFIMISSKTLMDVLSRLMKKSDAVSNARIQVQMPNGDLHDITEIKLMENMVIGQLETHRLVLKTEPQRHKMSKVINSNQIV